MSNLTMPVAVYKEKTHLPSINMTYPVGAVAIPPMPNDPALQRQWINSKRATITPIGDVFREYNIRMEKDKDAPKILFTHLFGGIGDIIAFSAVSEYFKDRNLKIHIADKMLPVTAWFKTKPQTRSYFDPIALNYSMFTKSRIYATFARMKMEFAAIDAGAVNWYDAMFQRIGFDKAPEGYDRPHLRNYRFNTKFNPLGYNTILISHRSSCQMRSSHFEDFYLPVKEVFPNRPVYVHEVDLTDIDRKFIEEKAEKVNIIPKCNTEQYLENLFAAAFVVCTDSSAIHFREGVERPCLSVYGAMTTQSRTSGYKRTRSFNVTSDCKFQPCFLHELVKGAQCHNSEPGETVSKCQTGDNFRQQLTGELLKYADYDEFVNYLRKI